MLARKIIEGLGLEVATSAVPSMTPPRRAPLLDRNKAVDVIGPDKTYVTSGGWFRPDRTVPAASEVSFSILKGETPGLVGESGSGKSSVARLVLRLIEAIAARCGSARSI